jgi:hypothetical protein
VRNAFYFFRFRNFNEQIISEQHFSDFYVVISNRFHSQEPAQHCRGEQRGTQQEIARKRVSIALMKDARVVMCSTGEPNSIRRLSSSTITTPYVVQNSSGSLGQWTSSINTFHSVFTLFRELEGLYLLKLASVVTRRSCGCRAIQSYDTISDDIIQQKSFVAFCEKYYTPLATQIFPFSGPHFVSVHARIEVGLHTFQFVLIQNICQVFRLLSRDRIFPPKHCETLCPNFRVHSAWFIDRL